MMKESQQSPNVLQMQATNDGEESMVSSGTGQDDEDSNAGSLVVDSFASKLHEYHDDIRVVNEEVERLAYESDELERQANELRLQSDSNKALKRQVQVHVDLSYQEMKMKVTNITRIKDTFKLLRQQKASAQQRIQAKEHECRQFSTELEKKLTDAQQKVKTFEKVWNAQPWAKELLSLLDTNDAVAGELESSNTQLSDIRSKVEKHRQRYADIKKMPLCLFAVQVAEICLKNNQLDDQLKTVEDEASRLRKENKSDENAMDVDTLMTSTGQTVIGPTLDDTANKQTENDVSMPPQTQLQQTSVECAKDDTSLNSTQGIMTNNLLNDSQTDMNLSQSSRTNQHVTFAPKDTRHEYEGMETDSDQDEQQLSQERDNYEHSNPYCLSNASTITPSQSISQQPVQYTQQSGITDVGSSQQSRSTVYMSAEEEEDSLGGGGPDESMLDDNQSFVSSQGSDISQTSCNSSFISHMAIEKTKQDIRNRLNSPDTSILTPPEVLTPKTAAPIQPGTPIPASSAGLGSEKQSLRSSLGVPFCFGGATNSTITQSTSASQNGGGKSNPFAAFGNMFGFAGGKPGTSNENDDEGADDTTGPGGFAGFAFGNLDETTEENTSKSGGFFGGFGGLF